jgi:hypothetical protein
MASPFYVNLGAQPTFIPAEGDASLKTVKEYECILRRRVGSEWPAELSDAQFASFLDELVATQHASPLTQNGARPMKNRPYKVFFANGDWTCSIARFHGTMTGPMLVGGKTIPPTGKRFEVDFCTVARWHDGQIVEENLFYDGVGMMTQLGIKG